MTTEHTVPWTELSRALDEIFLLRTMLAAEARVREADLTLKSYPKSRRGIAEERIEKLRHAAQGHVEQVLAGESYWTLDGARRSAGMPDVLTLAQWEAEV